MLFRSNGKWLYVPNKSGGFIGFYWGYQGDEHFSLGLQLEARYDEATSNCLDPILKDGLLCFKISVDDKFKPSVVRNKWHDIIIKKSKEASCLVNVVKPERFGSGKSMTVCTYDGDYRVFKNNKIDIDATVDRLKAAEELLDSVR